jgi:23S rRNA pseudouridine1911/1915/1917 synthase
MPARAFKTFHVDDRLHGASLAAALKSLLGDVSWAGAKRLIAARHVQVHGNLCVDDARRLKSGDVLRVYAQSLDRPPDAASIAIVYADDHLAVVEKPAGVTSVRHAEERDWSRDRRQKQPTLEELLAQALSPATGPAPRRAGAARRAARAAHRPAPPQVRPVHRLDRDTSGLMVFARSARAERKLIELFAAHRVERVYRAVVHARPAKQTIETWLVRDRGDGLRGSTRTTPPPPDAQRAVTHVTPVASVGPYTLVECRLETGRTHQIRIHLSELGHALCGEKLYTRTPEGRSLADRSDAPRHALHAAVLGFAHPVTDERLRFESDWPIDLKRWIDATRSAG